MCGIMMTLPLKVIVDTSSLVPIVVTTVDAKYAELSIPHLDLGPGLLDVVCADVLPLTLTYKIAALTWL